MKLYDPSSANKFVFAAVATNAKEGTDPTYVAVSAGDVDAAEASLMADKRAPMRNAYPYVMGRYDEHGRYCTYLPPVEGIRPGRFVLHPLAQEEHKRELVSSWR
jgi:hypothetical protein